MKSTLGRIYVATATVFVFFLVWAVVAAAPWSTSKPKQDPRVVALTAREAKVRKQVNHAQKVLKKRWGTYAHRLDRRKKEINAAWRAHQADVNRYRGQLAWAIAHRPVIYRTVVLTASAGGSAAGATASTGGGSSTGGGVSSGGGYTGGGASGGSAPVASAPAVSAPSVGLSSGGAVTSSGTS